MKRKKKSSKDLRKGPCKEHGTNKILPTRWFRKGQKERGHASPNVLPTSQNPSGWNPPGVSNVCITREDAESEWLAETTWKLTPSPQSPRLRAMWQSSAAALWRAPLHKKLSGFVSPCISSDMHLWVLDRRPLPGPRMGCPSYHRNLVLTVQVQFVFWSSSQKLNQQGT